MVDLAHRIYSVLDELKGQEGVVLLVCHATVIRALHTYFADMTAEEYATLMTDNASFREYELK